MDTNATENEAKRLYLKQRANRFLMGCIASGIASFILFTQAFGEASAGAYGVLAIFLAMCCIYCNYRRREIEQQIARLGY